MKRIYGILIALIFTSGVFAQVQPTPYLQIQLYTSQLTGNCNLADALTNGDTIYMHSGLDWYTPIPQSPDSIWQSIVGHWGVNDGIGEMEHLGGDTFSITIKIKDYFYYYADPPGFNEGATGVGPMDTTATPYNMGMVFRIGTCLGVDALGKPQCTNYQTGKDENCSDIFILNMPAPNNDSTINVVDDGFSPFTGVTARYVQGGVTTGTGIKDVNNSVVSFKASPSPFTTQTTIKFSLINPTQPKLEIFNVLGQKVVDLSSHIASGYNYISWNGQDTGGNVVPAGVYLVQITNGDQLFSSKIVKQ